MEKSEIKAYIAKRVAKEFKDGDFVNLGIGLPTMVPAYLPEDVHVTLEAELGMAGAGSAPDEAHVDWEVVDAGGAPSSIAVGGAYIDSATSFGLIRGGHVDATVLGALQVDQKGNLANWIIPGKMVPGMGGAMDLCAGASNVIVAMEHTQKGNPKILKECTLPLTTQTCVTKIITEMAVIDVTDKGLVLKEYNPEFTVDQIKEATEAELIVADDLKPIE
ncbi:MAG: 3-oxoacid CoA-transferase subunit B [Lachnospiraceae bacterium]|nr:3-oxoacid CoA-transferase subunit B [Lachnospiraceae bacterium]